MTGCACRQEEEEISPSRVCMHTHERWNGQGRCRREAWDRGNGGDEDVEGEKIFSPLTCACTHARGDERGGEGVEEKISFHTMMSCTTEFSSFSWEREKRGKERGRERGREGETTSPSWKIGGRRKLTCNGIPSRKRERGRGRRKWGKKRAVKGRGHIRGTRDGNYFRRVREGEEGKRERVREKITLSPLIGCDLAIWHDQINNPKKMNFFFKTYFLVFNNSYKIILTPKIPKKSQKSRSKCSH